MKTFRHKVHKKAYTAIPSDTDACCICGIDVMTYTSELSKRVIKLDKSYIKGWPDEIIFNGYIYHLCSPECRQVFEINPLAYIEEILEKENDEHNKA